MSEFDFAGLAESLTSKTSAELRLAARELGQPVNDVANDVRAAISDTIGIGRKTEAGTAELRQKWDLLPRAGRQRLQRELVNNATSLLTEADRRTATGIEVLRERLIDRAQPPLEPGREALARQELTLSLGEATGDGASARAITIARTGSRECLAALNSTFGETLLAAHDVTGRSFAETRETIRLMAAQSALEKATDPGEIMASTALQKIDALGACRGAAGSYALRAIDEAKR